ncbi:hypothetical protein D3C83_148870 [compost metagenome]
MPNPHGVDFEKIIKNAELQDVNLEEITLFYEGLTDAELLELRRHGLLTSETGRCVMAKFNKEGIALFPDKVTAAYSLGA